MWVEFNARIGEQLGDGKPSLCDSLSEGLTTTAAARLRFQVKQHDPRQHTCGRRYFGAQQPVPTSSEQSHNQTWRYDYTTSTLP